MDGDATPRRVTIHDVAGELGLSTSTVSAALNGNGKLRDSTRERVRKAAAELGYRPSRTALAFRRGRTGTIALALPAVDQGAVPMLDLDFYMTAARAAATAAFEAGYALTLTPPTIADEEGWNLIGADGVVVCDPVRDDERLAALERTGTPVVTIERDPGRPDDPYAVTSDHAGNMRMLLDHLRAEGARSIALVAADASWSWTEESVAAYREWSAGHGMDELIRFVPLDSAHNDPYAATVDLLDAAEPPDAIIASAEQYREGVVRACRDRHRRIPDDVRVAVGIDSPAAERNDPPLTAIDLQPALQARLAVDLLLHRIDGDDVSGPVLSESTLRVRASTLPPT